MLVTLQLLILDVTFIFDQLVCRSSTLIPTLHQPLLSLLSFAVFAIFFLTVTTYNQDFSNKLSSRRAYNISTLKIMP